MKGVFFVEEVEEYFQGIFGILCYNFYQRPFSYYERIVVFTF